MIQLTDEHKLQTLFDRQYMAIAYDGCKFYLATSNKEIMVLDEKYVCKQIIKTDRIYNALSFDPCLDRFLASVRGNFGYIDCLNRKLCKTGQIQLKFNGCQTGQADSLAVDDDTKKMYLTIYNGLYSSSERGNVQSVPQNIRPRDRLLFGGGLSEYTLRITSCNNKQKIEIVACDDGKVIDEGSVCDTMRVKSATIYTVKCNKEYKLMLLAQSHDNCYYVLEYLIKLPKQHNSHDDCDCDCDCDCDSNVLPCVLMAQECSKIEPNQCQTTCNTCDDYCECDTPDYTCNDSCHDKQSTCCDGDDFRPQEQCTVCELRNENSSGCSPEVCMNNLQTCNANNDCNGGNQIDIADCIPALCAIACCQMAPPKNDLIGMDCTNSAQPQFVNPSKKGGDSMIWNDLQKDYLGDFAGGGANLNDAIENLVKQLSNQDIDFGGASAIEALFLGKNLVQTNQEKHCQHCHKNPCQCNCCPACHKNPCQCNCCPICHKNPCQCNFCPICRKCPCECNFCPVCRKCPCECNCCPVCHKCPCQCGCKPCPPGYCDPCRHLPCDKMRCRQACADIMESVALAEAAIAHILNAEGEKIQLAVAEKASICQLLKVNESVQKTITKATYLEQVLCGKLEILLQSKLCSCNDDNDASCHEDDCCNCDDD